MKIKIKRQAGSIKEENVKEMDYKKLLKAAQKVIDELSLPLGSWLVKVLRHPEQSERIGRNIVAVLNTAVKMIPQLAESKAEESFIEFLKQSLIQSGKPDLANELQAMIDNGGLSIDSVEVVGPQPKKASVLREKDKNKTESDRDRKDRLHPGYSEMRKIAIGITEEESEEESEYLLYPTSNNDIKKHFERFV